MSDTLTTAGDYRARLEQDVDRDAPDWDGQGYVFAVDYGARGWRADEVHRDSSCAPMFDLAGALSHYGANGADWDMVERYLRVWHGVVSFDRDELTRSGPTHVVVVTRAQADAWGCPADRFGELAGQTLGAWRQWAEGDVWSYVIERRETWTNGAGDTMHTWEHVDSLSGMYGRDYAESEARDALETVAGGAQ